jgi:uncharacterized membrane protein
LAVIWVNHHDAFKQMRYVDRTMQFTNLLLLMTVVAIPFPTSPLISPGAPTCTPRRSPTAWS